RKSYSIPADALERRVRIILSYGAVASALFCCVTGALAWFGQFDRSGWTEMTRAAHDHFTNTHLGYCCFYGAKPVMEENIHSDRLIGYFSGVHGSQAGLTCYAYRGWYSFICTLLAPFVGVMPSMQIVNWLAWALAAWAAYQLAVRLFEDRLAGVIA